MYKKQEVQQFTITTGIGDITLIPMSGHIHIQTSTGVHAVVNNVEYSLSMYFEKDSTGVWKENFLNRYNRKVHGSQLGDNPTVSASRKIEAEMEKTVNSWARRHPAAIRTAVLVGLNNDLVRLQEKIQEKEKELEDLNRDFRTKQKEHGELMDEDISLLTMARTT